MIAGYLFWGRPEPIDKEVAANIYLKILPELARFEEVTDTTARAFDADGKLIAYIGFGESFGYGGAMIVGTIVDPNGLLREPVVIEHRETSSWMSRVASRFNMYNGLPAISVIVPGHDIDTITGATLTHRAVSDVMRRNAHSIAVSEFDQTPQKIDETLTFGIKEIIAILLIASCIAAAQVKKLQRFRLLFLAASIIVLGFWLNRALSVAQFSSLFLGYSPSFVSNPLFYIMILGALLPILILGKNLYCVYICPFCGVLELLHKIGVKNVPYGKSRKWLGRLRNLLLFITLMAAMVTTRPNAIAYEPFGALFGFDTSASNLVRIVLVASIVLGLFFRRLWCVALCPTGAFLDVIKDMVLDVRKKIQAKTKKNITEDEVEANRRFSR